MALTEAQLCNLALSKIGERQFIGSLVENSPNSRTCAVVYPQARDAVLERHWWSFATRRSVLAETVEERTAWGYAYALPADCLVPQFVGMGGRNPSAAERVSFAVEMNDAGNGHLLLTDQEAPELSYTAKVTSTAYFSALFCEALTWDLASRLALAIPIKPAVALELDRKFNVALRTAIAGDLNKRRNDQPPESEFITVRR